MCVPDEGRGAEALEVVEAKRVVGLELNRVGVDVSKWLKMCCWNQALLSKMPIVGAVASIGKLRVETAPYPSKRLTTLLSEEYASEARFKIFGPST